MSSFKYMIQKYISHFLLKPPYILNTYKKSILKPTLTTSYRKSLAYDLKVIQLQASGMPTHRCGQTWSKGRDQTLNQTRRVICLTGFDTTAQRPRLIIYVDIWDFKHIKFLFVYSFPKMNLEIENEQSILAWVSRNNIVLKILHLHYSRATYKVF